MMLGKVLFVDDDQRILNGVRRQFEDILDFETAIGPEEALHILEEEGPFAVVVSDMRMPGMNGIELLMKVKERSPDTVRIMLTGYADLQATIAAINEGSIFRFLSKPCAQDILEMAVRDGLAQYKLVTAERELLEGTLHGSVKVLSEMLSLANPLAFGRTSQVQRIALAIGEALQVENLWDLRIATMLFPIGCVAASATGLDVSGRPLTGDTMPKASDHHAFIGSEMLRQIPRLEAVARIVAYQDKCFDGSGYPQDTVARTEIPIGARILKLASDFEIAYRQLGDPSDALKRLDGMRHHYDEAVVAALRRALHSGLCQSYRREVSIDRLSVGMFLAADVRTTGGQLMVSHGQEITASILRRLRNLNERGAIDGTFHVECPGEIRISETVPS